MAAGGRSTKYRLNRTKQGENSAANVTAYMQSLVSRLYDYNILLVLCYGQLGLAAAAAAASASRSAAARAAEASGLG